MSNLRHDIDMPQQQPLLKHLLDALTVEIEKNAELSGSIAICANKLSPLKSTGDVENIDSIDSSGTDVVSCFRREVEKLRRTNNAISVVNEHLKNVIGKDNPAGRIRDLQKAGALIAAEIDRLQRIILNQ